MPSHGSRSPCHIPPKARMYSRYDTGCAENPHAPCQALPPESPAPSGADAVPPSVGSSDCIQLQGCSACPHRKGSRRRSASSAPPPACNISPPADIAASGQTPSPDCSYPPHTQYSRSHRFPHKSAIAYSPEQSPFCSPHPCRPQKSCSVPSSFLRYKKPFAFTSVPPSAETPP